MTESDNAGRLWQHVKTRWELVAFVIVLAALIITAITWLPEKMVQYVYRGDHSRESGNEYAKLVDDYRKTVVQILGGAFLLYTLYLTLRRTKAAEETLRVTQKSLELTQKSLEVTRETQITDRFTKAIEQLGATDSQGKKLLEIRFGGIYSLERIAKDSPDDHWPIMEILTAYVRQNAPWRAQMDSQGSMNPGEKAPGPEKDIQAIMTVIGRGQREWDKGSLNFSGVDLQKAMLAKAYLEKADFCYAHLEGAILADAHLEGAKLMDTHLQKALLIEVHLRGAGLLNTHLEGATLVTADLKGTILSGAYLKGADLTSAHLEGAFLEEAHLEGAKLLRAHLEGAALQGALGLTQGQIDAAFGDHTTQLPEGLTYPEHWPKQPSVQT